MRFPLMRTCWHSYREAPPPSSKVLPEGFDASDLARVNEYLLAEGHPIGAMNRVRKPYLAYQGRPARAAHFPAPNPQPCDLRRAGR